MRAGHRLQHQRGVHHCARHRRDIGVVAEQVGDLAVRDDAVALLQPDRAVGRGRDARRAAAVGGHADRPDAGRDGDGSAAARSTRRARRAPGVARAAEQRRIGQRLMAELRRRRLAEQEGAGLLQPRDGHGVLLRHVVLVQQRAEGGANAGRVDEVLGGVGDAVQQAERPAAHHVVLGLPRGSHRLLGDQRDEAVQHRLQRLGPCQDGRHQLYRRDLLARDLLAKVGGGEPREVAAHPSSPSCSSPPLGREAAKRSGKAGGGNTLTSANPGPPGCASGRRGRTSRARSCRNGSPGWSACRAWASGSTPGRRPCG